MYAIAECGSVRPKSRLLMVCDPARHTDNPECKNVEVVDLTSPKPQRVEAKQFLKQATGPSAVKAPKHQSKFTTLDFVGTKENQVNRTSTATTTVTSSKSKTTAQPPQKVEDPLDLHSLLEEAKTEVKAENYEYAVKLYSQARDFFQHDKRTHDKLTQRIERVTSKVSTCCLHKTIPLQVCLLS